MKNCQALVVLAVWYGPPQATAAFLPFCVIHKVTSLPSVLVQSFVDTAAPPSPALAKGNLAAFSAAREERAAAAAAAAAAEQAQAAAASSSDSDPAEQEQANSRAESGKAASTSGAATGTQAVEGYVAPDSPHFTGLVFKLQSNMDPKHRDKVAFVRVVSGKFEKGMKVSIGGRCGIGEVPRKKGAAGERAHACADSWQCPAAQNPGNHRPCMLSNRGCAVVA
jgi:hypothetical protein